MVIKRTTCALWFLDAWLPQKDPEIVTGGTRVRSGQSPAQVLCFMTEIVGVFRQAPQRLLGLRWQPGVSADQTAERLHLHGWRNIPEIILRLCSGSFLCSGFGFAVEHPVLNESG